MLGKVIDVNWDFSSFPYIPGTRTPPRRTDYKLIRLKITLKDLPDVVFCTKSDFKRASANELVRNLTSLINDKWNADIKIYTKGEHEFFAHKGILQGKLIYNKT